MSKLTRQKLRAARDLLDWDQSELATQARVSIGTVKNFEREFNSNLNTDTANKIIEALLRSGVEILEYGVRYNDKSIITYEGSEGFLEFRIDLYNTMRNGGEILVQNVDERDFIKWQGGDEETVKHAERMLSINNLSMRILIQEGDTNFVAADYAKYRWMPANMFTDVPVYIYGNKRAEIVFEEDNVLIFVTSQPKLTDARRELFNQLWEMSSDPK